MTETRRAILALDTEPDVGWLKFVTVRSTVRRPQRGCWQLVDPVTFSGAYTRIVGLKIIDWEDGSILLDAPRRDRSTTIDTGAGYTTRWAGDIVIASHETFTIAADTDL